MGAVVLLCVGCGTVISFDKWKWLSPFCLATDIFPVGRCLFWRLDGMGISRCHAELSGDAGLSRTLRQQQGFSPWPLSAFAVPSSPEGHVNGEKQIVCGRTAASVTVDVCTEESGMIWCVCVPHVLMYNNISAVNDKMLLTLLSQVTRIWIQFLYAAPRWQTKVLLVLHGPPSTASTFCHPQESKPVI